MFVLPFVEILFVVVFVYFVGSHREARMFLADVLAAPGAVRVGRIPFERS